MPIFKMNILAVLVLFLELALPAATLAQYGYKIGIATQNVYNKTLILSVYNGSATRYVPIDSLHIQQDTVIYLEQKQKIIPAVYRLHFKGDDRYTFLNINVDNDLKALIKFPSSDIFSATIDDQLNQDFFNYQKENIVAKKYALQDVFINRYSSSTAGLFLKIDAKIRGNYPENPEELKIYKKSYLELLDLTDKRIPLLPNSYNYLHKFFNFSTITNEGYIQDIYMLFQNQTCNNRNYFFYLDWIFKNLSFLDMNKMKDAYQYAFYNFLNTDSCKSKDSILFQTVNRNIMEMQGLPIGGILPHFKMANAQGLVIESDKIIPLHQYTFFCFYDSDCSHCKKEVPQLTEYFKNLKSAHQIDVQLVAFHNSASDTHRHTFIETTNLQNWLNVMPVKGDESYRNNLFLFYNPKYFLVDKSGKILYKDFTPRDLNQILLK